MPQVRKVLVRVLVGLAGLSCFAAQAASTATPQALPYIVTTVAGGAASSPAAGASCGMGSTLVSTDAFGDGCLATQVLLSVPRAVAGDSQGNLFIVDSANVAIRRVDARSGIITTIAGGGVAQTAGSSCGTLTSSDAYGDGCLGTAVKLAAPEGLAVDAADNVWFSDYTLGSVRMVSHTTGIIQTIVNTTGTTGYKAGNVADPGVVVPAAQGVLLHPYGITFDNNGNLYIADNYNNSVEAVNLGTTTATIAGVAIPAGAIYTIAGSGCVYGTAGCGSNYGKTNGVATASLLDSPYQIAVDNAGNIYIADEYPYDVRVITGGNISVFANQAYTKSATIVRGPAISTSLASTFGVATDALGNVYIGVYESVTGSSFVDRVDIATGIIYPVIGQTGTAIPTAGGAVAGATYCAAKTNAIGDGCPGTMATAFKPYQPFVDAAGNLYFADQGNNAIRKVSVGTQFAPAGIAVGASVTQSVEIHVGASDTLASYTIAGGDFTVGTAACGAANSDGTTDCVLPVTFKPTTAGTRLAPLTVKSGTGLVSTYSLTGTGLGAVLAIDPGTKATLTATGATAVAQIAADQVGNTYAAVPSSASVAKFTAAGVASTVGTGLAQATAVTVDAMGNVYAALGTGTVVEVPASGAAQVTIGSGFTKPSGLAVDGLGNVYVADAAANQVSEISPKTGVTRVIATAATAGLNGPTGLALDALNDVFVANTAGNNVVELPVSGTAAAITLGSGLSGPGAVATDAAGSLYIADTKNGRVVFLPNESGKINTADALTVVSGLKTPTGVAVAGNGTVTVADSTLNAIYTYTRTSSAIAFGNDGIGTQLTAFADITSSGNLPVGFPAAYYAATGNTTDFSVTPTVLGSGTSFAAGQGQALTAGFDPTVAGARAAVFTFAPTNATAPTLSLSGVGIIPINPTTTTITYAPTAPVYGQTVMLTITVAGAAGTATPTGMVTVNVDTTTSTVMLTGGAVTIPLTGLQAGNHTVTAAYAGDANSSASSANGVTITVAKAPLTVTVNSVTKPYYAALPTFTGTATGAVYGDTLTVSYTTTATATSALGTYPITATLTGNTAANYVATVTPGVLTIAQAGTTTTLTASSYSVTTTTSVTLTATVVPATGGTPTGMVTFFNGTTAIGQPVTLINGKASLVTTFAVMGQSTTNTLSAVYTGDGNYMGSTSLSIAVVSSFPGFLLTGQPSTISVAKGQSGLTSFTITPTFGYAGTVNFSCTGLVATTGCSFSPASISATGTNTASLVTLSISTTQAGLLARAEPPAGRGVSPIMVAGIPGFLVLLGLASRKRLRASGLGRLTMLLAGLLVASAGLSGCAATRTTAGTPSGSYAITVIATGTPVMGTAPIVQQFTITLNVQ